LRDLGQDRQLHPAAQRRGVTVDLAVRFGLFLAMLDSDLFLPKESWDADRRRCTAAHIPGEITHRSKWLIALEEVDRAVAEGVGFDWLVFDEGYGGKPAFLHALGERGQHYVCEMPKSLMCWPTPPRYDSLQAPFADGKTSVAAKRVDNAAYNGKPFRNQPWKPVTLFRQTLAPQTWRVKAAQVYL